MTTDLSRAIAICVEYYGKRPGIRSRLEDQTNSGLKAQSLEQTTNVISNPDRADEEAGGPRVTDVTGEAAIRSDRARRMLSDLDRAEAELIHAANVLIGHPMTSHANLVQVLARHGYLMSSEVRRSAAVFDRVLGEVLGRVKPKAGMDHAGAVGCGSCQRLKVKGVALWSDPNYRAGKPTDLGGILTRKLSLCWGCYRFVMDHDRLPTVEDLRFKNDPHENPRGHWPKKHAAARKAS